MVDRTHLIVLSGPSGSGKSTLINKLFEEFGDKIAFSVSHTTRSPRANEIDGKHYHFVSALKFAEMVRDGAFVEHASFSGNSYGTSKAAIDCVIKSGKVCILDIDMQGVRSLAEDAFYSPMFILIQPPNLAALESRLRGRSSETEESLRRRLEAARAEMDFAEATNIPHKTIINDDVDLAYDQLSDLIKPFFT